MINEGDMVRMEGRTMRVIAVFSDFARCVFIDHMGRIQSRWHLIEDLDPLWLTLQPRSLWPELQALDVTEIVEEERRAAQAKKLKAAADRKAKRKHKGKSAA